MDLAGSFKEKFEEPEKVVKEEHKMADSLILKTQINVLYCTMVTTNDILLGR